MERVMTTIEWCVLAMGLLGLLVWIRGCTSRSIASCGLGLAVAAGFYFAFFSLTRTAYLAAILFVPFLATLPLFRRMMKPAAVVLLGCIVAAAGVERKLVSAGNALLVIRPYRSGGTWRFDEPALRIRGEPFVAGIPEMIDKMVADIPGAENGFRLIFSQHPFPGADFRVDLRRGESGGNWYYREQYQMEGWLCPALFKFFPRAPRHIYVKAEAM